MRFIYEPDKNEQIIEYEKTMLEKYSNILDRYRIMFEQYNCLLKIGCRWSNFLKSEYSVHRLPFKNGYECYIYCEVQQNGKEVHIESTDGEVDYYALSASWIISSIERNLFKLRVSLYTNTDDIENDMEKLLRLLRTQEDGPFVFDD